MPSKTPGEGSFLPPPASMLPTIVGACQLTDATLPLSIPTFFPGCVQIPSFLRTQSYGIRIHPHDLSVAWFPL